MADSLGATYVLAGRVSEGLRGRTVAFTLYNGVTGPRADVSHAAARLRARDAGRAERVGAGGVADSRKAQTERTARARPRARTSTRRRTTCSCAARARATCGASARAADYFRDATRLARSYRRAYAELALADAEVLHRGRQLDARRRRPLRAAQRGEPRDRARLDVERVVARRSAVAPVAGAPRRLVAARVRARASRPTRATRRRSRTTGSRSFAPATARPDVRCSSARSRSSRDALSRSPRWPASPSPTIATRSACTLLNEAIVGDVLFAPAWAQRAVVRARHGDLRFAWADAETATQLGASSSRRERGRDRGPARSRHVARPRPAQRRVERR